MKLVRNLLSEKGIILTVIVLLMIASVLAMAGVVIEAKNHMASQPLLAIDSGNITSYVMTGVFGDLPSLAGTLQSFGLFVGFVVTPFVLAIMLTVKANLRLDDFLPSYAAYNLST